MFPIPKALAILLLTPLAHLVGACVLGLLAFGPLGLLAFPILALFGCYLLIPEFLFVAAQAHFVFQRNFKLGISNLILLVVLPGFLFAIIAPKEIGNLFWVWLLYYFVAGLAAFSATLILLKKIHRDCISEHYSGKVARRQL